jgi:hypothetical protein
MMDAIVNNVLGEIDKPVTISTPRANARTWEEHRDHINQAWRKSAQDFIDCGRRLAEAKAELKSNAFKMLVAAHLDFNSSVARKLRLIAANQILCRAPGHKLPANWTILYELSKLPDAVLKAALDDGTIKPKMSRNDAIALNPAKPEKTTTAKIASEPIDAAWETATADQRQEFLAKLGREGLCAAMSSALMAELRDHAIAPAVAGASTAWTFAAYATDKLHALLHAAEQPEPDLARMVALAKCIIKKIGADNITWGDVVIAARKPSQKKGRKK